MSLKEDLSRNRAVFERLTGSAGEPEDKKPNQLTEIVYGEPEASRKILDYDTSPPVQSFSLSHAYPREYRRETGMALGYEAPADTQYPALRENGGVSVSDPLDLLYRRLEADARQSSQLSVEEDF